MRRGVRQWAACSLLYHMDQTCKENATFGGRGAFGDNFCSKAKTNKGNSWIGKTRLSRFATSLGLHKLDQLGPKRQCQKNEAETQTISHREQSNVSKENDQKSIISILMYRFSSTCHIIGRSNYPAVHIPPRTQLDRRFFITRQTQKDKMPPR